MSKSSIPADVKMRLWIRSGGRCQYDPCNANLYRDDVTMSELNTAYIAHIVADSPEGPRGDIVRSPQLSKEFSNLMLLCDVHHRLIDREEIVQHPEERLTRMKAEHEFRIEMLTSIRPDRKSSVMLFGARIGAHDFPVHFANAQAAMIPELYPTEPRGIELGMANLSQADHEPEYWRLQSENLKRIFSSRISGRRESGEIGHLSVFAIAPQPLLILLGYLIGEIGTVETFQLHREPSNWKWRDHPEDFEFQVHRPVDPDKTPALVFALSDSITPERIEKVLGPECSIWTITVVNPKNDFLKSRTQLSMFRTIVRQTLREIKATHGEHTTLHVFPAMPVACAVDFGRVIMPKADMPMRIYDQNARVGGFMRTIDIPN